MSPEIVGVLGFVIMFVMIMIGVPIFLGMLAVAFVGIWVIAGPNMVWVQFTQAPISTAASFNYAVLPLFMLLGTLAGESGIASGALAAMRKWLGKSRGGILMAIVGANAVFGACSGVSVAGSIVFGKMALPDLEKQGYDRSLSLGVIVSAGTLGVLIPPSTAVMMFCILTELSIGTALVGGIGPAFIMIALYYVTIKAIAKFRPGMIPPPAPEDAQVSLKEKMGTLKLLIPIVLLFAIIIGGAFFGWFAATVGGAIGALAVTVYALVKKVPIKLIARQFWEAATMNAGIFPILVAGTILGRFVAMTNLPATLLDAVVSANLPPVVVYLLVMLFYIFCGCIMDLISIIIITVPITFPLLTGIGINPYVVCTAMTFMIEIAGMTPPVGMNVFALSNALRVDAGEIFKGIPIFFGIEVIMVILIVLIPSIVTFLPNLLG